MENKLRLQQENKQTFETIGNQITKHVCNVNYVDINAQQLSVYNNDPLKAN